MSVYVPNVVVIVPTPQVTLQFFVNVGVLTVQVATFVQVLP